jgi:hypothetical protein
MKYLAAALAALFVVAVHAPAANAETAACPGGVYNSACIAGAYITSSCGVRAPWWCARAACGSAVAASDGVTRM